MIPFFIGAIVGGFVGIAATRCCVAAREPILRDEIQLWKCPDCGSTMAKFDFKPEEDYQRRHARECMDCVYRMRYIERGE